MFKKITAKSLLKYLIPFTAITLIANTFILQSFFQVNDNKNYSSDFQKTKLITKAGSTTWNPDIVNSTGEAAYTLTSTSNLINKKPSLVTEADVLNLLTKESNTIFVNLPTTFNITITKIAAYDTLSKIIIRDVTLTSYIDDTGTTVDMNKNFGNLTISGFKDIDISPPGVTDGACWLNASELNFYPYQIADSIIKNDNQTINSKIISAVKYYFNNQPNKSITTTTFVSDIELKDQTFGLLDTYRATGAYPGLNNGLSGNQSQLKIQAYINNVMVSGNFIFKYYLPIIINIYNSKSIPENKYTNILSNSYNANFFNPNYNFLTTDEVSQQNILNDLKLKINSNNPSDIISDVQILTFIKDPTNGTIRLTYKVFNSINQTTKNILPESDILSMSINNFKNVSTPSPEISTSPILDANNELASKSNGISTVYASDISDASLSDKINENVSSWFNNLPNDYASSNRAIKILSKSANDMNGSITVNFKLTYAKVNGEDKTNLDGLTIPTTAVITGWKIPQLFSTLPTIQTFSTQQRWGGVDFKKEIISFLNTYINNRDNFSQTQNAEIKSIITNLENIYIEEIPSIYSNYTDVKVRIPDLAEYDQTWLTGKVIRFYGFVTYQPNTVEHITEWYSELTFREFKLKVEQGLITIPIEQMISVKNVLPPVSYTDKTPVTPTATLAGGNNTEGIGLIKFSFPKFYSKDGLITDYSEVYEFSFKKDENQGEIINNVFKNLIPITDISKDSNWASFSPALAIKYFQNANNQEQITNILNIAENKVNLFVDLPLNGNVNLNSATFIENNNTSIKVTLNVDNDYSQVVTITGLFNAQQTRITENIVPNHINANNLQDYFESGDILSKTEEFLIIENPVQGMQVLNATPFNIGPSSDPSEGTVAFINFTFNMVYANQNSNVVIKDNFIVQLRITGLGNNFINAKSKITYSGFSFPPMNENNSNLSNYTLIISIICISGIITMAIGLILLIWFLKNKLIKDRV